MELLIIAGIGLYLIYRFWKMIVKWLIILILIGVVFLITKENGLFKTLDLNLSKTEILSLLK
jgi:hypothetical protein